MKTQVLIVEDEAPIQTFLKLSLELSGRVEVLKLCRTGEEACRFVRTMESLIILLDSTLPGWSSCESIQRLKALGHKVILLALELTEREVFDGISAGADGFLLKSAERTEFLTAFDRVLTGEFVFCSRAAGQFAKALAQHQTGSSENGHLTKRQVQILKLLAGGHIRKEIADLTGLSTKTVATHLEHIYRKLGVRSKTAAAVWWCQQENKGVPAP